MNSPQFDECLRKGKIREFSRGRVLVGKELESAAFDLRAAKESLEDENYKWATIQTYYSMFHSARALLYNKNYREKSHSCLIEAIRVLYVEKSLVDFRLLEALQRAKSLREGADYYSEFSQEAAEDLLIKAEQFLNTAEAMLRRK